MPSRTQPVPAHGRCFQGNGTPYTWTYVSFSKIFSRSGPSLMSHYGWHGHAKVPHRYSVMLFRLLHYCTRSWAVRRVYHSGQSLRVMLSWMGTVYAAHASTSNRQIGRCLCVPTQPPQHAPANLVHLPQ